ncbi:ferredoxin [Mycobacterium sp. B14F4]|uniref:ferredoxin n=1 Tax=Mycobacterium sp. B14F4 TaxID=3153565 RepID=UPI00325C74DA
MTVRPDNRLEDLPMVPVVCGACGAEVMARKSSWQQTSVQWNREAESRCVQRRELDSLQRTDRPFLVCFKLRDSIEDAARRGALPIVDEAST